MPVYGYGYTDLMSTPVDDFQAGWEPFQKPEVWDYPFASVAALGVASLGIKSSWEYYFAAAAQFIYWLQGFKGLDGLTNALIGVQFGRGAYKYAMFATLLSTYETISDLKKHKGALTYKSSSRIGIYSIGYLLGVLN